MIKIAVLAANFSGNVGDLYILRAVTDFLCGLGPQVRIDVFPYAARFNRRVACAEQIHLAAQVEIQPHKAALRGVFEQLSRRHRFLEQAISALYFGPLGALFKSRGRDVDLLDYDAVVSVGGEMDTPYSFLDIHDYLNGLPAKARKPFVYGPISISPAAHQLGFLRRLFASVETVGIRDPKTRDWLVQHGVGNTELVPDCAFLGWAGCSPDRSARQRIGLCLHTSWFKNYERACRVVDQVLAAAGKLGASLVIYPTHAQEDYQLYRRLVATYRDRAGVEFEFPATSSDLVRLSRSLSLVISDRLHGLLVGMLNGANILPIKTRHKVIGYCEYLQLERAIDPAEDFGLIEGHVLACASDEGLQRKIERFCAESHDSVAAFYRRQLRALLA